MIKSMLKVVSRVVQKKSLILPFDILRETGGDGV